MSHERFICLLARGVRSRGLLRSCKRARIVSVANTTDTSRGAAMGSATRGRDSSRMDVCDDCVQHGRGNSVRRSRFPFDLRRLYERTVLEVARAAAAIVELRVGHSVWHQYGIRRSHFAGR